MVTAAGDVIVHYVPYDGTNTALCGAPCSVVVGQTSTSPRGGSAIPSGYGPLCSSCTMIVVR